MARLGLAFRAFFKCLGDAAVAARMERAIEGRDLEERKEMPTEVGKPVVAPVAPTAPITPARSEALTLLAVLQREARLIDFLKEDLKAYSDAQIGAAVRDVQRDSAAALERMLALRPVRTEAEGTQVSVSADQVGSVRLTGNVTGQPPYRGALRHGGWQATKIELPAWNGNEKAGNVVAEAEVEMG